jgi:hypothetical protein
MTIIQVSSQPIVKAALIARLQADANLAGVQIAWGSPFPEPPDMETVTFGDVLDADTNGATEYGAGQFAGPMGQGSREERYAIQGYVYVRWHNAETQQAASERAYAIASAIEYSIRIWSPQSADWPQLPALPGTSIRQVHWVQSNGISEAEGKDNQHARSALHIPVAVAARI